VGVELFPALLRGEGDVAAVEIAVDRFEFGLFGRDRASRSESNRSIAWAASDLVWPMRPIGSRLIHPVT
jgi:hypothetical protein